MEIFQKCLIGQNILFAPVDPFQQRVHRLDVRPIAGSCDEFPPKIHRPVYVVHIVENGSEFEQAIGVVRSLPYATFVAGNRLRKLLCCGVSGTPEV